MNHVRRFAGAMRPPFAPGVIERHRLTLLARFRRAIRTLFNTRR